MQNYRINILRVYQSMAEKFPMDKVRLRQSQPYMLKKAEDQSAFYRLLTKLLWYLGSGKSHVGYLCNCPRNPFVAKEVSLHFFFIFF
jgi:hypothetical protein